MIQFIVNKLGFYTKKQYDHQVKLADLREQRANKLSNLYKGTYEVEKSTKPFDHNAPNEIPWSQYWDEEYRDRYIAKYIRKIAFYPELLTKLLVKINQYDLDKVYNYMVSVNWTWGGSFGQKDAHFPTKEQMIETIISLFYSSLPKDPLDPTEQLENKHSYVESGGFKCGYTKDREIILEFSFDY